MSNSVSVPVSKSITPVQKKFSKYLLGSVAGVVLTMGVAAPSHASWAGLEAYADDLVSLVTSITAAAIAPAGLSAAIKSFRHIVLANV